MSEEAPAKIYRKFLESGKLGFQRCHDCGVAVFYPRVLCPTCGCTSPNWQESNGNGKVYATTAIYRRDADPYNVALIDLDEGFRMMSRVVGVPAEQVEVGMQVRLKILHAEVEGELPVAVFEPVEVIHE